MTTYACVLKNSIDILFHSTSTSNMQNGFEIQKWRRTKKKVNCGSSWQKCKESTNNHNQIVVSLSYHFYMQNPPYTSERERERERERQTEREGF